MALTGKQTIVTKAAQIKNTAKAPPAGHFHKSAWNFQLDKNKVTVTYCKEKKTIKVVITEIEHISLIQQIHLKR